MTKELNLNELNYVSGGDGKQTTKVAQLAGGITGGIIGFNAGGYLGGVVGTITGAVPVLLGCTTPIIPGAIIFGGILTGMGVGTYQGIKYGARLGKWLVERT